MKKISKAGRWRRFFKVIGERKHILLIFCLKFFLFVFNWDSLHAILSSHYELQEKEEKNDEEHIGKLPRKNPKVKGIY